MRAAYYERTGPADEVLVVGGLADPLPGAGEVRVRVAVAGINPADVKRRAGSGGRTMSAPLVVPGDDGAGVIDRVGAGVPADRIGERVWVYSANHRSAFGTSAELVVVPADQAVELPPGVAFETGACLGVPALTAHRALFADGPVDGRTVLVTGAGAVAHYAIQLARHAGATVVATASTPDKQRAALAAGAARVVDYRRPDAAAAVLDAAGGPVDRVVDVAFGANLPLTSAVIATNGTIASYGSDAVPEPAFPFYPLMRRGVTIRTVLVFVMPEEARRAAIAELTRLLAADALSHPVAAVHPLDAVAAAHAAVEDGTGLGKVLLRTA